MNKPHFFSYRRVLAGAGLLLLLILLPTATAFAAGPPRTTYIVRYGDTLNSICARFGVSLQSLLQANGYSSASRALYVGQQMYVPYRAPSTYGMPGMYGYSTSPYGGAPYGGPAYAPSYGGSGYAPSYGSRSSAYRTYVIRFGDTLTGIAIRFHTSVYALMIANNIPNPNLIFAGTRLVIPAGSGYAQNSTSPYGSSPYGSSPYGSSPYGSSSNGSGSSSSPYGSAPSAAPTAAPTAMPGGSSSSSVSLMNIMYNPRNITVRVGTQVTWTNNESSQIPHTVTSGTPNAPSNMFDSGTLNPGQTFQFTFNTPGTYNYFCRIHGAAMTGTVTVTP